MLHSARYRRKPRGRPAGLGEEHDWRFSFCCARDGCRTRRTPPSFRFLGRKVYLATMVVLIAIMPEMQLLLFSLGTAMGSHKTIRTDDIATINQAANLIAECAATRQKDAVVIIDELDRIKSTEAKSQIAELIKRIHDMRVDIKLVMCGIGKTLDEIIGSHLSASRAITPFELAPISFDARWEIVNNAADKLGFNVDRKYLIRISQISDGFPYYIHLIAENLFWEVFDHKDSSLDASSEDFHTAITRAISRAEAPLREKYNYAIQKTKNSTDYEEALWAVAEGNHFERQLQDIYSKSYLKIMRHRSGKDRTRKAIKIDRFRTRLYSLCKESHGHIVVRKRNSWYAFDENVIRGYVRLVAERAGVPLGSDHFAEADDEVVE